MFTWMPTEFMIYQFSLVQMCFYLGLRADNMLRAPCSGTAIIVTRRWDLDLFNVILQLEAPFQFFTMFFEGCPCTAWSSWASAEIFPGGQRRHFAYHFQFADVSMQMEVHKSVYCFYTTKKMPQESTRSMRIYFEILFKWRCTLVCRKCVLSVTVSDFAELAHKYRIAIVVNSRLLSLN